jgi:hypothetical protein
LQIDIVPEHDENAEDKYTVADRENNKHLGGAFLLDVP